MEAAHKTLEAKNGPGSDFLGWMYLPCDYDKEEFARIKAAAAKIREDSDVLVVAGDVYTRQEIIISKIDLSSRRCGSIRAFCAERAFASCCAAGTNEKDLSPQK